MMFTTFRIRSELGRHVSDNRRKDRASEDGRIHEVENTCRGVSNSLTGRRDGVCVPSRNSNSLKDFLTPSLENTRDVEIVLLTVRASTRMSNATVAATTAYPTA